MNVVRPIRIGVSSCLLGRPVRYDGGHKRHDFIVDVLGPFVEFVPVCPEVELGLGSPRETLRLVRRGDDVHLVMATGDDYTKPMRRYATRRVEALASEDLSGYILKKDSPSCGLLRVKVYRMTKREGADPVPAKDGRGLFAEALVARWPHLPIEEEGRLQDARLRENFIERVFAWRRLRNLFAGRWSMGDLVRFHTAHKLVVLAHSPVAYRALGQLVAGGKGMRQAALRDRYRAELMAALSIIATPKKHANVLQHMVGCFRGALDTTSRDELLGAIEELMLRYHV